MAAGSSRPEVSQAASPRQADREEAKDEAGEAGPAEEASSARRIATQAVVALRPPQLLARAGTPELEPLPAVVQDVTVLIAGHRARVVLDLVFEPQRLGALGDSHDLPPRSGEPPRPWHVPGRGRPGARSSSRTTTPSAACSSRLRPPRMRSSPRRSSWRDAGPLTDAAWTGAPSAPPWWSSPCAAGRSTRRSLGPAWTRPLPSGPEAGATRPASTRYRPDRSSGWSSPTTRPWSPRAEGCSSRFPSRTEKRRSAGSRCTTSPARPSTASSCSTRSPPTRPAAREAGGSGSSRPSPRPAPCTSPRRATRRCSPSRAPTRRFPAPSCTRSCPPTCPGSRC